MSSLVVSLLISAGAGTWIYTKLQRYSGNNTKQSAMGAAAAGIFLFIILIYVVGKLLH
jgi:divalent metal cation (Fe/Co/Zn/Cd) transporter